MKLSRFGWSRTTEHAIKRKNKCLKIHPIWDDFLCSYFLNYDATSSYMPCHVLCDILYFRSVSVFIIVCIPNSVFCWFTGCVMESGGGDHGFFIYKLFIHKLMLQLMDIAQISSLLFKKRSRHFKKAQEDSSVFFERQNSLFCFSIL